MRISILVWDLSMHSIVRTYPIAKVLERRYKVEILGPLFGDSIYEAYKDEFLYKTVMPPKPWWPVMMPYIRKLVKEINGDVIYAFKPLPTSFGISLLGKLSKGLPVVLDIEDWEAAPFVHLSLVKKVYSIIRTAHSMNGSLYPWLMESMVGLSDQITVVSDFLQKRFGGVKLPHGANCSIFNPKRFNKQTLKAAWGLSDKKVILFSGTALPHKGLGDLVQALSILDQRDYQLLIIGKKTVYLNSILQRNKPYIKYLGLFPHSRIPEFLSLSDLIVLPQRNTPYAQAQVPGKVFEAMAMAKPIIATAVSDLPEILEGCGWIVEPENPKQLAEAIQYVFDHPAEAEEMGWKAREKCIEKYSWDAMEKILLDIFRKYE